MAALGAGSLEAGHAMIDKREILSVRRLVAPEWPHSLRVAAPSLA
jgi:hypothetical protein